MYFVMYRVHQAECAIRIPVAKEKRVSPKIAAAAAA